MVLLENRGNGSTIYVLRGELTYRDENMFSVDGKNTMRVLLKKSRYFRIMMIKKKRKKEVERNN